MAHSGSHTHADLQPSVIGRVISGPGYRSVLSNTLELHRDGAVRHVEYGDILRIHIRRQFLGCEVAALLVSGERIVLASFVSCRSSDAFEQAFNTAKSGDLTTRRQAIESISDRLVAAAGDFDRMMTRDAFATSSALASFLRTHAFTPREVAFRTHDFELPRQVRAAHDLFRAGQDFIRQNVDARNETYIQKELQRFGPLFDRIEANPLTNRQRRAVVINEDRNLVVAGAGTGKTSTVVARVGYLLEKGVDPGQILVLAFARKAMHELEERIEQRVGTRVEVRTFHSLGRMILGQASGQTPTLSKAAEDEAELERRIGSYLDEMLEDARAQKVLLNFFAYHLKPQEPPNKFKTRDDHYRFLRAQGIRSLRGEQVKSQQEAAIANWLLLNGVAYEYEARYQEAETADQHRRQYQPDFKLTDYGIYLEHFGVDRQGRTAPFIDAPAYREEMRWKKQLHAEHGTTLLETYSYQFIEGTVWDDLASMLEEHGVETRTPTPDELRELIDQSNETRPLVRLIKTFLHLYKSAGKTITQLRKDTLGQSDPARCNAFLDLFEWIESRYQQELDQEKAVDFDDLIREATAVVQSGGYQSPFTHILVDEFQDIATGRASLVRGLLDQVPGSRLFAVGDDWQSIYRFTGSDVGIMTGFQDCFGPTRRTDLDKTFRYSDRLLQASSHFITRNPDQLKKDLVANTTVDGPVIDIRLVPRDEMGGSALTDILSAIKDEIGGHSATVMILGRYRFSVADVAGAVRGRYPQLAVETRTVHTAKGLEADYVVVLDVSAGRYGFPSEIADDPLLSMVQSPDSGFKNAEERRLFYVAMTRARRRVYLVGDEASPSPFINELQAAPYAGQVTVLSTGFKPATCGECQGRLVKRGGPHGPFWGCSNYPYCRGKGDPCVFCGGALVLRAGRFYCNRDGCDFDAEVCPRCRRGSLKIKNGPYGRFWACSLYPACEHTRSLAKNQRY